MRIVAILCLPLLVASTALGIGSPQLVEFNFTPDRFPIVQAASATPICVAEDDWAGVTRAAQDFRTDVARVTGITPALTHATGGRPLIIVGTLGKSSLIDDLVHRKKIDSAQISGKWEATLIQVVKQPAAGVEEALVVAGSDKRGTMYGLYELSEQIGVSPWYWWADVPVKRHQSLFVKPGQFILGPPAVQYRGIFLNDEAPALSGWAKEKFGGFNHNFYTNVFELLLRLRANFLWPAMWNNSFATDDPLNAKLADEYGIVMGTSHHEPMMRAWKEWARAGNGPHSWDYSKNDARLREFWSEGLRRTRDYEKIITLGMRGDGDEPMSETESTALLERIVADQRRMISAIITTNLPAVPQVWALYKEVQSYFEHGMRVPDDVTLLWCDDNWGNLRRLPTPVEQQRPGGAGIYYHFDYVGGPRNYKWLNTVPLAKVREQMDLAYHHKANRIWMVNVGDLKPMEIPIEFFLTFAWHPEQWTQTDLDRYLQLWATREFGPQQAATIADLAATYTKYNGRRKPELLEAGTFSLINYGEADRVAEEWHILLKRAESVSAQLPSEAQDAFFELILHPIKACSIVNRLYIDAAKSRLYAAQGRSSANEFAATARALFAADAKLTETYHRLAGGKWNHMMSQTHIGYTNWQEPPVNNLPALGEVKPMEPASMAVALEGSNLAWPGASQLPELPLFDRFGQARYYIDVFNRGKAPFVFQIKAAEPWIAPSAGQGTVTNEARVWVDIDWSKAPTGRSRGSLMISGAHGQPITIQIRAFNPTRSEAQSIHGFVEASGYLAIEAAHYTAAYQTASAHWDRLPDYGRTDSSVSVFPVTAPTATPPSDSPRVDYLTYLFTARRVEVTLVLSPSLNYSPERGVRIGLSIDDEQPKILNAIALGYTAGDGNRDWEETVKDSIRKVRTELDINRPGPHTFKVWMVDPGIVLERVIIDTGGLRPSYLGPLESVFQR